MKMVLIIVLVWLASSPVMALLKKSDEDYYLISAPAFDFIYSWKERGSDDIRRQFLNSWQQYTAKLNQHYQKSFGYVLSGRPALVLPSWRNQIANAQATVFPEGLNVYYGGGAPIIESFASPSWMKLVVSHEMAHLYQMDANRELGWLAKKIFGSQPGVLAFPPMPLPIFMQPNAFLPRWLLEGNAVFNESLLRNGGRLYSGADKALFYSLLGAGLLNENRLTNSHLYFPYAREKYVVGGFFNLFLAQKYGVEHCNRFFFTQSKHYLLPIILTRTFKEHFGRSYAGLIKDFLNHFRLMAEQQVHLAEDSLQTSIANYPLNSDEKKIFFLTDQDGKSERWLNVYHKESGLFERRPIDRKGGKLFPVGPEGSYLVASSGRVDKYYHLYGLWGEGRRLDPQYRSKFVMDFYQQKPLYIDIKRSIDAPIIFWGDQSMGTAHSQALFDTKGQVHYFKQQGSSRTLFKNGAPLFSYAGYDGKLTEIDAEGNVYFVAPTEYGISLFIYRLKEKDLVRPFASDTINDARLVSQDKGARTFLVSEQSAYYYQYKLAKAPNDQLRHEGPYITQLKVAEYDVFNVPQKETKDYSSVGEIYHPFTHLTYRSWSYSGYWSSVNGLGIDKLIISFADSLQQNTMLGILDWGNDMQDLTYKLIYLNRHMPFDWAIDVRHETYSSATAKRRYAKSSFFSGQAKVQYLWAEWEYWQVHSGLNLNYTQQGYRPFEKIFNLTLRRERSFALSMLPYRMFGLDATVSSTKFGEEWEGLVQGSYDIGQQYILQAELNYRRSENSWLEWGDPLKDDHKERYLFPSMETLLFSREDLDVWRLSAGLQSELAYAYYFPRFPLSLRRIAPRIFLSKLGGEIKTWEYGAGLRSELLFAHIAPFNLQIDWIKNTEGESSIYMAIVTDASTL